ncbi:DUF427 domain-containing protein [Antrihabitans sp. YC3-6]|uniref:DUF427 domain-containing protein n=1 Tax=Antrihabitans stalagmiti TaxID=2799499 RepID=A0A934U0V8_9NOCA|nr:DUF427 domain-containing protein [Antrihabitans stalagmiti]MBJ8337890.1 DUF427 domain-containing protein [Antrihabitans stalagmiti]
MADYPSLLVPVDHIEPVPRRIRAVFADRVVVDTTAAKYVWEWPSYPQYYLPLADVDQEALVDERHTQRLRRGIARVHGLTVGEVSRPSCARVFTEESLAGLAGMVRFDWAAMDSWFEENEEVFVHPRCPYTRVDALRSSRLVRIELGGVVLAESSSPVLVFETGLPTRYYFDRTDVNFDRLLPNGSETGCPYKGITSGYWSAHIGGTMHHNVAWTYNFPTRQLQPIAGLVAFYNEHVDTFVDGTEIPRPVTHFT